MLSILLVEDLPLYRKMMEQFLRRQSGLCLLGTAANGEEALQKAQHLKPDFILIDIRMPVMSGLDAIPRLRELLPEVGIIVLTVLDEEAYRLVSADLGADAYVNKANVVIQLPQVIDRIVQQRKRSAHQKGSDVPISSSDLGQR